ncbi:hypothetical protein TNCV_3615771 [Trichonephila clavipes]|nr:hypothetical protein TNCV_3615771 [Trichonephila clavipes]
MDTLQWRESSDKQAVLAVAYGLPTVCEEPTCSACTSYLSLKSNRFTGSVELSGKFTTRLTSILLNGRLQGFVIQGLLSSCSSFITEGQISRPEFLKQIPCRTFIDITIPKRLTYSAT